MKIRLKFMQSLILLMLFFSINGISQKKTPQTTKKTTKTEFSKCTFSEKEIDLTIEQLPPNYIGNNLQFLSDELIKKGKFVKDEFETTAKFQERVVNEKKKKIVGELSYNSFLAFSDKDDLSFTYNADFQKLDIDLGFGSTPLLNISCQTSSWTRLNTLYFENRELTSFYKFKQSFELDVKTAKILKPNLRILLIGQLNNLIGDYYTSPTVWGASIFRQEQTIIQNKSKRDQSQNNFNLATRELTRAKSLVDAGMIPRNEYNQAAEAFDEAKTNLTNAEKNLETVKYQLIPFIVETSVISQKEKPSINVLIKEIWIYDISTGKIWLKRKI